MKMREGDHLQETARQDLLPTRTLLTIPDVDLGATDQSWTTSALAPACPIAAMYGFQLECEAVHIHWIWSTLKESKQWCTCFICLTRGG